MSTFSLYLRRAVVGIALFVPSLAFASQAVTHRDIGQLIKHDGIPHDVHDLKAFVADATDTHHGYIFHDGKWGSLYRDGTLIVKFYNDLPEIDLCSKTNYAIWMTDDGHLVYVASCKFLYVDDKNIATDDSHYRVGKNAVTYQNGKFTYPEGNSVKQYDPVSGEKKTLFQQDSLFFVRVNGSHVAYSTWDTDGSSSLYLDGKKVSAVPLDNPANFLLMKNGDVFYYQKTSGRFQVYKNSSRYLTGKGAGGFLYADERNVPWFVTYALHADGRTADVWLYEGKKKKPLPKRIGNIEGTMAFQDGQYAARVQGPGEKFVLMKNGVTIGQTFEFLQNLQKDFAGLFFSSGMVYMRNFIAGRWMLFEDGEPILSDTYSNIWFARTLQEGTVKAYGTK